MKIVENASKSITWPYGPRAMLEEEQVEEINSVEDEEMEEIIDV
jgi:hypothetical protein